MTGIYKRRRSNNWWIRFTYRGRKYRESSNSPSLQVAQALLRKRLGEIGQGQVVGRAVERIGVDELLEDLLAEYRIHGRASLRTAEGHVAALMPRLGRLRVVDLTTTHLRAAIEEWQAEGVAPATINKRMTSLRRAFHLGRRTTPPKVLQVPVFERLREDNIREGYFERGEVLALLGHLPDNGLRDFVEWGYWTGMRKGEIGKLEWSAFDRETRTLTLPGRITKNGRPRRLSLAGPLWTIIERRLEARRLDCRLIFHRDGLRIVEFRKSWATACRKAGIVAGKGGRIFHDLRRTGVRNLRLAGVDRKVAMMISGHRTEAMFARYNIDSDEDLRDAVEKVASYVGGLPSQATVVPIQGR